MAGRWESVGEGRKEAAVFLVAFQFRFLKPLSSFPPRLNFLCYCETLMDIALYITLSKFRFICFQGAALADQILNKPSDTSSSEESPGTIITQWRGLRQPLETNL